MNLLVFADSFLMVFLGVGFKGNQGIGFGFAFGLAGGIAAVLMFNVAVVALITLSSRDKAPKQKAKV